YFKIPKAFRPQLCDRYPLTAQDSIYSLLRMVQDFSYIRYIRYKIRCRTSFFLKSVTSVTSVTKSVAELLQASRIT
ncbi:MULTISPECIES: hypothetical protein, partial [unclassified Microcoleus]|uniref:hypothetical protein n=1 Tax=unclassified Microcoleus TaxID=2642155 RepID=UPI002FD601DE